MNVMIFGGTTEGRELSYLLAARGARVTVSVATDYGREEQGSSAGITVLTGRKDAAQMTALLRGADLCVDATHPYAVEATRAIRALPDAWASAIPIIAMTADAFSENVAECMAAGMNGHIAKPIDLKLVFKEIRRIREERRK